MQNNLVHGSDSPENAAAEIALWFRPEELVSYQLADAAWVAGELSTCHHGRTTQSIQLAAHGASVLFVVTVLAVALVPVLEDNARQAGQDGTLLRVPPSWFARMAGAGSWWRLWPWAFLAC